MSPTVETAIVNPPPPPPLLSNEVLQAARGTRQALADCGYFPRVGTLDDYLESKARCSHAVYRCLDIWSRYLRRFDQPSSPIERAPTRLWVRHFTANGWWISRCEVIKLLTVDVAAGSA
jgi:hypothetical protein